jgi:hypothetical protein
LEAGRFWSHDEIMRGARLAVVNRTLARRYWPQGNALGQQIRVPELKPAPPYSVVTVMWTQILVRARGEPLALLRAVT